MATNTLDHGYGPQLINDLTFEDPVEEALALVARVNRRLQAREQVNPPSRRLYKTDDRDYGPDDVENK